MSHPEEKVDCVESSIWANSIINLCGGEVYWSDYMVQSRDGHAVEFKCKCLIHPLIDAT
jgi:hypothetical protein